VIWKGRVCQLVNSKGLCTLWNLHNHHHNSSHNNNSKISRIHRKAIMYYSPKGVVVLLCMLSTLSTSGWHRVSDSIMIIYLLINTEERIENG